MADLHAATSTYDSGTNDTYTAVVDGTTEILAAHQNGPASAIVAIETVLGSGTTLPGSLADLATRLAVAINTDGKLKALSASTKVTFPPATTEGCTGSTSYTDGEVLYYGEDTSGNRFRSISGVTNSNVATTNTAQTFSNKTLTTPTIGSFANATHDHTNAAGGGLLTGNAGFATDTSWTGSLSASSSTSSATVALTIQTGSKVMVMCTLTNNAAITNANVGDIYLNLLENDGGGANTISTKRINPSGVGAGADESIAIVGAYTEGAGGTVTFSVSLSRAAGGSASAFDFVDVALVVYTVA